MDRSGNIDENDQQRKSGRIRISLTPNPFETIKNHSVFKQELDLKTGAVNIYGQSKGKEAKVKVWVEVHRPRIHIEAQTNTPSKLNVAYESWRTQKDSIPRHIGKGRDYNRWACYSYTKYNGEVWAYPDSVSFENNCSTLFYHRNNNKDLVFDYHTYYNQYVLRYITELLRKNK